MNLLLHACCADCTLKFIASLKKNDLTIYYYNPNIHPRSEYQERLKAIQKVAIDNHVKIIIPNWQPRDYFSAQVKGKGYPRCHNCWQLRLSVCAKFANENGFSHLSTTLLTSKYQDRAKVEEIGQTVSNQYQIVFYVPDTICTDLHTSGFYKQSYCGCCYSLTERFQEKFTDID